ncbi:MAG: undecaprenyl/decaprenyl-phosphate alpha-N-acetylglucosaminyl 1-phosphate transferase [Elusimicrobiota bacterium]|jgi:UDP-GlcNAc:undecaprenyl-phosphate GlcNAc-1-phosphate transferase|nr:undecaprenyl/decaprenyl-phosphate alpha-N-acetylglucosaminyl 1-phosphate transferase [Elusimicrobiota bacterium]
MERGYKMNFNTVYFLAFVAALLISAAATPIFRLIAVKLNIFDRPITEIKTHKVSTPYLGGAAVAGSVFVSLCLIRLITDFPDGTLRSLRGIIYGSAIMFLLGLIDDIKFSGLGYKSKLVIQIIASSIAVFGFDIRINFIPIYWISCIVSIVWITGVSNALNIIDIMDGLSSGIAVIASLAFFIISLPTEMIYVNFCALALAGGIIGFMPYNLSKSKKIFLGDAGSLFIGFVLACLSLGTYYSSIADIGIFAPLFILAIPLYETFLVSMFRIRKGQSPLLGSKDHYALRLEKMGWTRKKILIVTYIVCALLAASAYLFTKLTVIFAGILLLAIILCLWSASVKLASVKVE